MSRLRSLAALLLLAYGLTWSSIYAVRSIRLGPNFGGLREIRQYDGPRFAALKPRIRALSRLGYVEDAPLAGEEVQPKFYLAQFALAPVVLVGDSRQPNVLGNFRRDQSEAEPPPGYAYRLVLDCGNGVKLYQCRADR